MRQTQRIASALHGKLDLALVHVHHLAQDWVFDNDEQILVDDAFLSISLSSAPSLYRQTSLPLGM
jgi:hypothetical protein